MRGEIYEAFTVSTDIPLTYTEYNGSHECISPFP